MIAVVMFLFSVLSGAVFWDQDVGLCGESHEERGALLNDATLCDDRPDQTALYGHEEVPVTESELFSMAEKMMTEKIPTQYMQDRTSCALGRSASLPMRLVRTVGPTNKEAVDSLWKVFLHNADVELTEEQILQTQDWRSESFLQSVNHVIFRKNAHIVYNGVKKTYMRLSTPQPALPEKHGCVAFCELFNGPQPYTFDQIVHLLYQKGYARKYSVAEFQTFKECLMLMGWVRARNVIRVSEDRYKKRKDLFDHVKGMPDRLKQSHYRTLGDRINGNDIRIVNTMVQMYRDKVLEKVEECYKQCAKGAASKLQVESLMLEYMKGISTCAKKAFVDKCQASGWVSSEETFWRAVGALSIGGDQGHIAYSLDEKMFSWVAGPNKEPVVQTQPLLALYTLCRDHPSASRNEQVFVMQSKGIHLGRTKRMGQLTGLFVVLGVVSEEPALRSSARERGAIRLKMLNRLVVDKVVMDEGYYSNILKTTVNQQDVEVLRVWRPYVFNGELCAVWQAHRAYLLSLQKNRRAEEVLRYSSLSVTARSAPALYSHLCKRCVPDEDHNKCYTFPRKKQRLM